MPVVPTTKKATAKKAVAKAEVKAPKATKKSAPKEVKEASDNEFGVARSHDLPWGDKKVSVFKALKQLKAFDLDSAKSAAEIAEKSGVTKRDVRHYCYHAHAKVSGLVDVHNVEGVSGYSFSLTKKGQAIDPVAEFKKQEQAKAGK